MKTFGYSHPELPRVDAPVGEPCGWCAETIAAGDLGVMVPHLGEDDEMRDRPVHRECFLRQIVGSVAHQRKTCHCFGGADDEISSDLSIRQEAIAAVAIFEDT